MPKGELLLKIPQGYTATTAARYDITRSTPVQNSNGVWMDAYEEFGMSLEDTGISALMTPVPAKARAKNRSRLNHGETLAGSLERKDAREITLPFHISAQTKEVCLQRYHKLCQLLDLGTLVIWSSHVPTEAYHCKYLSCTSFSEFMMSLMKYSLKVEEPNPYNRAL